MRRETLDLVILICLIIASITSTTFPLLYSFSRWDESILGRAMMSQSIAFAMALDLTLLFHFWRPPFPYARLFTMIVFVFIAGTTTTLSVILWKLNYQKRLDKENHEFREQPRDGADADCS